MSFKRKIIAVSGARSEYDLLYSLYKKLDDDSDIDFSIIITGPNLSENYGYTAKQIEDDNFKVSGKIYNLIDSSEKIGRIVSIGNQIGPLANLLDFEKPDIVLIAGDREEAITVSLTCAYLDIPVAHFFGGDIAKDGNIDNSVRYAASKFSHLHFPTLEEHRKTLLRLGEDDWRIFVIGNPAIDRILEIESISKKQIFHKLNVTNKQVSDYCVLIQHPIITEKEKQSEHIRITLDSLLEYKGHCFINYPNSDAGNYEIIKSYQDYENRYPEKFTLFKNLNRKTYINLLREATFLIGNSSSGIIEVASLGLPAINVGTRQRGRIHGDNVIFTNNDKNEISNAIQKIENDVDFIDKVNKRENPYGNGNASSKALDVLKNISIDDKLIYKNITY